MSPEALPGVASVALALTTALRRVFRAAQPVDEAWDLTLDDTRSDISASVAPGTSYLSVLDGTRIGGARAGARSNRTLTFLLPPLRLLCDFVGGGPKDAQTKVYATGALLNFLFLLTPEKDSRERIADEDIQGEGWSLRERMGEEHWRCISSYGPSIAASLARDATQGPHALKVS